MVIWELHFGFLPNEIRYANLFDHLVRAGWKRGWKCEVHQAGHLQIDGEPEAGWLFDRKISRLGAFENPVDISDGPPKIVRKILAVGQERSEWHHLGNPGF